SIFEGIFIGFLAVSGMLVVVAFLDNIPVLPATFRDRRETLEYVASIALATVTGAVIAVLMRRMLPRKLDSTDSPSPVAMIIARMTGRYVGAQALRRRARKIQDNFRTVGTAAAALVTGVGSIYTGMRALLGS